jgi:hypothetical protein
VYERTSKANPTRFITTPCFTFCRDARGCGRTCRWAWAPSNMS